MHNLKLHFIRAHKCAHCSQILNSAKMKQSHEKSAHPEHTTPSVETSYNCEICNKEFNKKDRLIDHKRRNHRTFPCKICKQEFPLISQERKHQFDAHGKQKYKCGACDYETIQECYLKHHVRRVHMNEKHVQCPLCDHKSYNQSNLNYHMIRHTKQRKYDCKHCGKSYPRLVTLKMHTRIHTGEKTKVCTVCDEAFVQKSSLNHHMMKCHPGGLQLDAYIAQETNCDATKKHSCRACKVAYARLSDLRNHVTRTHLRLKTIKCNQCPQTFMYHSQRKQHTSQTHSREKLTTFVCELCGRNFKRKNTLAAHMMDIHILKKCSGCDAKFARKTYLYHLNERHGRKIPTCGICGLKTLKESTLIRHQRNVHLKEKNIRCTNCEKTFCTRSNLLDHMVTHSKERVFQCGVCHKTFARKQCLRAHGRIHTGERPFVCRQCAAAFTHRAGLRSHLQTHHGKLHRA